MLVEVFTPIAHFITLKAKVMRERGEKWEELQVSSQ